MERQALMVSMMRSYWPLVAIEKGESTDLAAAAAAAQTMNDGMVKSMSLFPAGTAKGEVPGSRAKPEIWTQSTEFRAAADELISATANLVDAANSGDVDTFKAQFRLVDQACSGCHEFKPSAGGKFRFAKEG
jgi:cytochrome c556